MFGNTALAISEGHRLASEMAEHSRKSLLAAIELIKKYDYEKAEYVRETETLIDKYEDKLGTYLVGMSTTKLSERESHSIARMLHSIGDFERIGDHALNICKVSQEINDKKIHFSDEAFKEIDVITDAIIEIINLTVDSFINDDAETAGHIEPLEQVIDKLNNELRERHVKRLQSGECTIELGFIFTDLLTNYERVSDHCSNIAVYTMQLNSNMLDAHKYLHSIKSSSNESFVDEFNRYDTKYNLKEI